jgi:hypothetical protein
VKLMFKNSDSDSDTEVGHTRNGDRSERFLLRTYLRKTTEMRDSTVEKKQI